MNILFVNQTPITSPKGAERSALNIAIGLSEIGHDVEFLQCGEFEEQNTISVSGQTFLSHTVKTDPIHPEFSLRTASIELKGWLDETDTSRYDIIHSHNSAAHVGVESANPKSEIVATIRDYHWLCEGDAMCYSKCNALDCCNKLLPQTRCSMKISDFSLFSAPLQAGRVAYKMRQQQKISNSISGMDQVIMISETLKEIMSASSKLSMDFGTVIHNSVMERNYENNPFSDTNEVLFVGSLKPQKGILEGIKAFSNVLDENPDSHFTIAGDGRLRSTAQKFVEELDIDQKVTFLGHVSHERIAKLFNQASVVVYPSIWPEPFGRISIESMASGTPIVGSTYGAIPEVLGNWPAGIVADPKDTKAFADAIIKQMNSQYSGAELSLPDEYSYTTKAQEHEKLYQNVLARGN